MSEQTPDVPDVRKSIVVRATPEHCFKVFTESPSDWWPPSHVLLEKERAGLAFEPYVGGRYYEWDVEGTEIAWGKVLTWEPPNRLSMTWRIDGRWRSIPDDERASEIEVAFEAIDAEQTRVSLAHVKLHKHGADAPMIHRALDGASPGETLDRFGKAI